MMTEVRKDYYNEALTFAPRLPSIYAVELASYCQLKCNFCPRGQYADTYIDPKLVETIVERDLSGSRFIEFQQTGEPTLHKQFNELVDLFHGKVLMGTSTNGNSMLKCIPGLLKLNYITVSIDSVTNYERVRRGGRWTRVVRGLHDLINAKGDARFPKIDLQLIEFPGYQEQAKLLADLVDNFHWTGKVTIRTVPESFAGMFDGGPKLNKRELCLNPWLSVNIQADGDVVPCCLMFGKQIVYGNVKKQSLEEIWNTSPVVVEMREKHLSGDLPHPCASCRMRSPCLFHDDLIWSAIKSEVL
jgi:radical SAM protein with 4Fe4S-binding SPASM domain